MSFELLGRFVDGGLDKLSQPMPWWGTLFVIIVAFFIARWFMEFIPQGVSK